MTLEELRTKYRGWSVYKQQLERDRAAATTDCRRAYFEVRLQTVAAQLERIQKQAEVLKNEQK